MLCWDKNSIKSNRYKITNKIIMIYIIDFIGYFILIRRKSGSGVRITILSWVLSPVFDGSGEFKREASRMTGLLRQDGVC